MTSDPREKLDRLIDLMIEETLAEEVTMPDKADAARARSILEAARRQVGRDKLATARLAVETRKSQSQVTSLDLARARSELQRALSDKSNEATPLMLAARKGQVLSERDKEGLAADLEELRKLESDDT
jgi:hypothetical protein